MINSNKKRYPKILANILLIMFGCLFGLIMAEILVRTLLSKDKVVVWLEMHDAGFMMNQSGGSAFQEFEGHRTYYSFTDNRIRKQDIKNQSAKTILTLGDSFTFGLLLSDENTFTHHLNKKAQDGKLEEYKFLNGGIGGAGLADWPLWLEHYGKEIAPDIVLYYLHVSDLERALSKNLFVLENDTLTQSTRWKPSRFMRNLGRKTWYRKLQQHSELANIVIEILWRKVYFKDQTFDFNHQKSKVKMPSPNDFSLESEYAKTLGLKLLERMDNWCNQNNCKLIITTTGFFEQKLRNEYTLQLYQALKNDELSNNIPFFDNTPCLTENAKPDYENLRIPNDGHPNAEGAAKIADCTWQWLPSAMNYIN